MRYSCPVWQAPRGSSYRRANNADQLRCEQGKKRLLGRVEEDHMISETFAGTGGKSLMRQVQGILCSKKAVLSGRC